MRPKLTSAEISLLVIAKQPVPGTVKTRLCPPLSDRQAAVLAAAAIDDTLAAAAAARVARTVLVLDGDPARWQGDRLEIIAQRGGGFAERLAGAFEDASGPALLIGMDTPQITAEVIERACTRLGSTGAGAVLGPAVDGGYWAIGLRAPDRRVFDGVPMSVEVTGRRQLERLRELGLDPVELEPLRDFDTIADAHAVAAVAPESRFAAALDSVLAPGAP